MRKSAFIGALLAISLMGTGALAQEDVAISTDPEPAGGGYHVMVVGGQISMGMAMVLNDNDDDESKARFAGGGFAYFDYYLSEMLAIEAGLGIIGKGARLDSGGIEGKYMPMYMEIPIGVKLNISNFRVAVLFAMDIGIGGKTKITEPVEDEDDIEWGEDNSPRRFNIAPKIALGYAIPLGPIYIVPGLDWSMHLLDDDDDADNDYWARNMNIMFNVAVEFGF